MYHSAVRYERKDLAKRPVTDKIATIEAAERTCPTIAVALPRCEELGFLPGYGDRTWEPADPWQKPLRFDLCLLPAAQAPRARS